MGTIMRQWNIGMALAGMLVMVCMLVPQPASAQAADDSQVCTNFAQRMQQMDAADGETKGILSEIYTYVTDVVDDTTENLYETFINNTGYRVAVGAAMTLMIIIFGVGFMIGIIQPSFGQALVRLAKFALVAALIAPSGWAFFSQGGDTGGFGVAQFFNEGTNELITGVMSISTGVETPEGATPFYQLDKLAGFIIQPDTIVSLMAMAAAGGPFGLAVTGLLSIAFAYFIKLLIHALRIYAVTYVARALLLGVAPIFFVFLLFDRTKQLFMSWLNALIAMSMQPILLFTFLSFFLVMIESATKDMLNVEFCWTAFQNTEGTANAMSFWRPVDKTTKAPITSELTWKGAFECTITGRTDCPEFPMNIVDVLTFLILVYLASRFAEVAEKLANELSNTYISLDPSARFAQLAEMQGAKKEAGGIAAAANKPAVSTPTPPPTVPRQGPTAPAQPPNEKD